jgi:hypothetical protein
MKTATLIIGTVLTTLNVFAGNLVEKLDCVSSSGDTKLKIEFIDQQLFSADSEPVQYGGHVLTFTRGEKSLQFDYFQEVKILQGLEDKVLALSGAAPTASQRLTAYAVPETVRSQLSSGGMSATFDLKIKPGSTDPKSRSSVEKDIVVHCQYSNVN